MNLVLRNPLPADYAALVSWIPDASACIRWGGPMMTFPLTADGLPGLLAVDGSHSYTLVEGDRPLGFGQFWSVTPGSVHLGRILVAPSARRGGVGTQLCRQLMARGLEVTGADRITLRVYPDNNAARALYERLGFGIVTAESTDELLFMCAPKPAESGLKSR